MIEAVADVVPLADQRVIQALEAALKDAREGKVRAVAVAIVGSDLSCWAEYCFADAPISALMGSIERMRHKLNLSVDLD